MSERYDVVEDAAEVAAERSEMWRGSLAYGHHALLQSLDHLMRAEAGLIGLHGAELIVDADTATRVIAIIQEARSHMMTVLAAQRESAET